jgi:hypothetical protein
MRFGTLTLVLVLALWLAAPAQGSIYWTNFGSDSIGRSALDGSLVDQSFIAAPTPPINPCGIAFDSEYIYWANQSGSAPGGKIGRAKLDGSEVDNAFITGADNPCGVAVNATHVFWANTGVGATTIGRAEIDGSDVDHKFITGLNRPQGVAVDGLHIYWTELGPIGRAKLNGSDKELGFISEGQPRRIAVDANHIYWADLNDEIGRADLNGTNVDPSFIGEPGSDTEAVAVNNSHIFWTNEITDSIARANLDGSAIDLSFIGGAVNPTGVAAEPAPSIPATVGPTPAVITSHRLRLLRVIRNLRRGTAKLLIEVSGAGTVSLARDRNVKGATRRPKAAGRVKLPLVPRGPAREQLFEKGRVKVLARVTFRPAEGEPLTRSWRRPLIRRLAG